MTCPKRHDGYVLVSLSRSYSLEGLEVERAAVLSQCTSLGNQEDKRASGRGLRLDGQEKGSLVSLTEEEQEGDGSIMDSQVCVCLFSVMNLQTAAQTFNVSIRTYPEMLYRVHTVKMVISRPGEVLEENLISKRIGKVMEICYIHMFIYAV